MRKDSEVSTAGLVEANTKAETFVQDLLFDFILIFFHEDDSYLKCVVHRIYDEHIFLKCFICQQSAIILRVTFFFLAV